MSTITSNEEIAKLFSSILKQWLNAEQLEELVELTKTETDPSICHSGDYCDSNMAMHAAFVQLGIMTEDDSLSETQELTDLWNECWDYAKANLFFTEDKKAP